MFWISGAKDSFFLLPSFSHRNPVSSPAQQEAYRELSSDSAQDRAGTFSQVGHCNSLARLIPMNSNLPSSVDSLRVVLNNTEIKASQKIRMQHPAPAKIPFEMGFAPTEYLELLDYQRSFPLQRYR